MSHTKVRRAAAMALAVLATTALIACNPAKPPVASSQNYQVVKDSPKAIKLVATDGGTAALSYKIVTAPAHGTLTGTAPNLTFTPAPGYLGSDVFTFTAANASGTSQLATVNLLIRVNAAPMTWNGNATVAKNKPYNFTLTGTDADKDPLTFRIVDRPTHGSITGTPPILTYTPEPDFVGADTPLTYLVNDGLTDSKLAGVINFNVVDNRRPVAWSNMVSLKLNSSYSWTVKATDPDGDPVTYQLVTAPTHGTLTGTLPNITYTPDRDYLGKDEFTWKASDGRLDSALATVSVTVTPNHPPTTVNLNPIVTSGSSVSFTLSGADSDRDPVTFVLEDLPTHGAITGTAPNLTYTPTPGFVGTDTLTYRTDDGELRSSIAGVITFTV
ncbi:MAG: family of calcium-binding protein [Ilumatobacteraceae bacterium]|nr:family of calcium-binding protein [Ilumatobacteraceae bacterium]